MNKLLVAAGLRALRVAVATWLATQVAHNIWYAPVIVAAGKALRDQFPGKFEWLIV